MITPLNLVNIHHRIQLHKQGHVLWFHVDINFGGILFNPMHLHIPNCIGTEKEARAPLEGLELLRGGEPLSVRAALSSSVSQHLWYLSRGAAFHLGFAFCFVWLDMHMVQNSKSEKREYNESKSASPCIIFHLVPLPEGNHYQEFLAFPCRENPAAGRRTGGDILHALPASCFPY